MSPKIFMAVKRLHVFYSGVVQGVGFRFTAERVAYALGLSGWVKNLRDGRVEVMAEGEEKKLDDFLKRVRAEMSPYINDAETSWDEPGGDFDSFEIRHF